MVSEFFSVAGQTNLYGWVNLFALLGVMNLLFATIETYQMTRSRTYWYIMLTLLASAGFFMSQFLFAFIHIDTEPIAPYIQFARTILFVATLFLASQTLKVIVNDQ